MGLIKENIVGLFRFICLLLSSFVFRPSRRDRETEGRGVRGKYEALIGPSEPLVPTEIKFCPRCHAPVAQVRRTKEGMQIIRQGKLLVTVGNVTITKDGQAMRGFPLRCLNGHTVRIE